MPAAYLDPVDEAIYETFIRRQGCDILHLYHQHEKAVSTPSPLLHEVPFGHGDKAESYIMNGDTQEGGTLSHKQ